MTETTARPVVTAYQWVPDFARGLVRDLRVRWALEEIGAPYESELLDARSPRPEAYLARQPFDQVPAFTDGDLQIFETGAILLYLGLMVWGGLWLRSPALRALLPLKPAKD